MTDNMEKVPFASPAWVELARDVLEDLIEQHGEDGVNYSVCEAFAEAPDEISDDDGFAAWYFYVKGRSVRVGVGRKTDTDIQIQATWKLSLESARTVYTPELRAEWEKNPPQRPPDPNQKLVGEMTTLPSYLGELHNRLAVVTE